MRPTVLALLLATLISAPPLLGQEGNKGGRAGAQFLKIGVSARAVGLGEAFVAVANDAGATFYNPSGLTQLHGLDAIFTNVKWPADISYNFLAVALPVEFLDGALGVHAGGLSTGEMIVRTPLRPEGTGETFEAADYYVGVSYARKLTDRFTFGVTLKAIMEYAYKYSATGWAVDLGSMYYTGFKSFRFGWIVSNFGPDMTYINEPFALPVTLSFGVAAEAFQNELHTLTLSAQASRPNDNAERGSVGAEYRFKDIVALRAGYKINYDLEKLSLGVGVSFPIASFGTVRFDYAYADMSYLIVAHRISLGVSF